jgi:hypothetical protein
MATKGTSWCLRRSVDLIPYLLFMAAREALTEPREWVQEPWATSSTSIGALEGVGDRTRTGAGSGSGSGGGAAEAQAAESAAE